MKVNLMLCISLQSFHTSRAPGVADIGEEGVLVGGVKNVRWGGPIRIVQ